MNKADQYIDWVTDLPPAPTIATELLGLFGNPHRDIDRIVELIGHDQSLTANVLRRCNSASFRGEEPVADMFEAIMRLGFHEVYYVVAALVGARAMSLGKNKAGLDVGSLWRHSVVTAVAATALARRVQESEAIAFTAGLLHDIGKQVFSAVEGSAYADLVRKNGAFGQRLADAELSVFGVTHARIGGRLLARWGLPESVAAAAFNHHGSPYLAGPFARLAATVSLANSLAHQMIDPAAPAPNWLADNPDAVILLQLSADDTTPLVAEIQSGLQRVQSLMDMTL
jgi:putative nucleotidyltransferase with HDIG domain